MNPGSKTNTRHAEPVLQDRGKWGSKIEFLLAAAGNIVGLGNMWRFPYLCYKNGGAQNSHGPVVKTVGIQVVYFTATFPYVMLVVLLVRGLTLPGAIDGIKFYLYPDPTRLADPQARTRLTSFVAGFAIFSVLGFMAYEQGMDISKVAESGPGLAFIAYPRAVAMMPVPQLWAICFFIMIIVLGLDSEFVNQEALVTAVSDMYPSFFLVGHLWKKLLLLGISVSSFLVGLLMVTEGTFVFYLAKNVPLKLNNTYIYPWWGYAIGGFFTLSSTLLVPFWMLYKISVTPGSLRQRFKVLTSATEDLPKPMSQEILHPPEVFQTFTDLHTLRSLS
ncbi:hypothetical protein DPEC_G00198800 [Dallia pectoralis]|uniref:Uncharacterized protein n=1 Tax=Dallia pectoralis TaxID=75939 RepID=A0ACC2G8E4_DALPE|nr:hypothetical protein DPEC_G00198800 [Dallia pectoralis]